MNAAGFRGEKRIDVNPRKKEGVNCGAAIGVLNMHIAGRGILSTNIRRSMVVKSLI